MEKKIALDKFKNNDNVLSATVETVFFFHFLRKDTTAFTNIERGSNQFAIMNRQLLERLRTQKTNAVRSS